MTEQQVIDRRFGAVGEVVPEWTVGDRMAKALNVGGVGRHEMADYLDVTTETIRRWINGLSPVKKSTLRLWSIYTNVSLEWLETGECAIRDSNPEPAD